jgi:kynurenine formamidase
VGPRSPAASVSDRKSGPTGTAEPHREGRVSIALSVAVPHFVLGLSRPSRTWAMDLVDLSHRLDASTPAYPGDPVFSSCPALTLEKDGCNVSTLSLGTHTGTHVDAPYHFLADGKRMDELALEQLVGRAVVLDLTYKRPRDAIEVHDVADALSGDRHGSAGSSSSPSIILLHTGWDRHWGTPEYHDHPYLTRTAAEAIVRAGYRVIGIDAFSPDPTSPIDPLESTDANEVPEVDSYPAHHVLLGAGCAIVENLTNLGRLVDDAWCVSLAPLKIGGGDGAPVRAFAWRNNV